MKSIFSMRKNNYQVQFSRFVNGDEYPAISWFRATSEKDAANQLDKKMKEDGDIHYKVKEINRQS